MEELEKKQTLSLSNTFFYLYTHYISTQGKSTKQADYLRFTGEGTEAHGG